MFGYLEDRAFVGILDVVLDRHQAFLAHLGQYLEQHGQQVHVQRLVEVRALEHLGQRNSVALTALMPLPAMKPPSGEAEDRHVFHGHPQRGQAAVHGIGADRGQPG
jgi:hypothetical protein